VVPLYSVHFINRATDDTIVDDGRIHTRLDTKH
jgi:hypothetical protein